MVQKIQKAVSLLLFLLFCCVQTELHAQTSQAGISGTITDEKKEPIPGATVLVKNEATGFTTGTSTSAKGEYTFRQLPLGGPYTITVSFIGYSTQTRSGYTLNLSDILRLDVQMQTSTNVLDAVVVNGSSMQNNIPNLGASTAVNAQNISKLPVLGRNFTTLIDLSPLSRGGSVSGQLATSTNYTIDGMTAKNATFGGTAGTGAPYSISIEAVREFKVVTNQYDVTYGRSGGGTINTATKAGTNTFSGSAFSFVRADWLSSQYDIRGNKRNVPFSTYQYGFSLGGPIIKDKAQFFVAYDHQRDARPLQIADIQGPADEQRLNVTQSTLDRYLDIARTKYGVANSPQFGSFDKKENTDAIFARLDFQLNDKNLLTISNNYIYDKNNQNINDNTAINLYEVYGTSRNKSNSTLASLRSTLSPRLTNELKLQQLSASVESISGSQLPSGFATIPRAIVDRIQSSVADRNVFTSIQLGGQRYAPEYFFSDVSQLTNNVYFNTDKINFTFGTDLMYSSLDSRYGSEVNGRFFYTGLDNFDKLAPYRYAREIPLVEDPSVQQHFVNAGLYAQMQTKLAPGLDVMAGIRADYTTYLDKPNFNQVVFDELGLKTDHSLNTFQLQPRAQFTWDVGERQKDIIRLGGGIFGSDILNYTMINNMVFDGTKLASVDITNSAAQPNLVPTPNFPGYRNDPSTSPGAELFNIPGVQRLSTINLNREDVRIPVVYKANFSYNRFLTERLRVGASAYMSLARNNYMYTDANMVDQPYFRLANEDNRGVYVPANTISPSNGVADWTQGRKTNRVGRVLALNSDGKVNQYAFVLDGTYRYFQDGEFSFSYTYNDTKDNTSYNGNVANTATLSLPVRDDPRNLSNITASDNQFRTKVVLYGTLPTFYGVSVGLRYSGIGGTRYSLLSGGNVNGDFVASNDLAYVFDPNDPSVPEAMRNGIQGILDNPNASKSLKDYVRRSIGKVAERNGGVNDFYGQFDIRVAKRFKTFGDKQYVEFSGDLFNAANFLNKKNGVIETLGNQNIYSIASFNQATSTYNYTVNANTGVVSPSGNPYQFQIGLRYGF
ncbi:TonB-dependent receptor [Hymenobacter volaticus]|uniref:Carboxypeptidase regulatory-like domain-containing protein n=1 Tax=Hymenobacter volaticus TaxID=2932254 RepID=A0ABY4GCE9_9BACT|nr:carboxypeptidase regulatory-like domain-containing protein [Hymenobacter volaticus]UOQ68579.1 carboxypeptidase regulatory-like domain-containing protein [Hymenobacter volaticus]